MSREKVLLLLKYDRVFLDGAICGSGLKKIIGASNNLFRLFEVQQMVNRTEYSVRSRYDRCCKKKITKCSTECFCSLQRSSIRVHSFKGWNF